MTRKLVVPFFVTTLGFLAIGTPMFAHHGTAGVYDFAHRITTKATVTEYIWANPHVQIYFKLKNDKGRRGDPGVETVSPEKRAREWLDEEVIQARGPASGELHSGQERQNVRELPSIRKAVCRRWPQARWQRQVRGWEKEAVDMNTLPVKPGYTARLKFRCRKIPERGPESEQVDEVWNRNATSAV